MAKEKIPRLSRLTAILLKLQTKSLVTIEELADHFQVSSRTIYRDLIALEESGVPLVAEDGKGYSLVDGYNMPPVLFTETEANALIIAEKFILKSGDDSLITEFNKAIDKIKSVLRNDDKEKSDFLAKRTIIGQNWENRKTSTYLTEIQKALTNRQVLQIVYKREKDTESTLRKVEPFAIYHNTLEYWVLIAWCQLRDDFRTFRLDRMTQLRNLEEQFEPHEMTLEEYVAIQKAKFSKDPLT